jgi:hypothetical protein
MVDGTTFSGITTFCMGMRVLFGFIIYIWILFEVSRLMKHGLKKLTV